ncbi:MAG TPA: phosphatase, partial [Desulfuromonas sp.]|nr:phosphatase [Desulfuromonas sp.]
MNRYVDLHLHSTCSDGLHPPAAVVAMAAGLGLAAIAIADHDNIDGIDAAMAAGAAHGVEVLSGVELSVIWQGYDDIHLLGYGFDHHQEKLRHDLTAFQDFRARRNEMIVERVNEKLAAEGRGAIDFAVVREKAGGTVGRPHIAMALVEAGIVTDSEAAFNRYLIPCNVAKRDFPIAEAIALIHSAGGVAVLAHPPFITS